MKNKPDHNSMQGEEAKNHQVNAEDESIDWRGAISNCFSQPETTNAKKPAASIYFEKYFFINFLFS